MKMSSQGLWIVAALIFASWFPSGSFPAMKAYKIQPLKRGLLQALQHTLYADRVAGKRPLPSATAFLWSRLLWKVRFSLQEIVTKDEDKKKKKKRDHMPRAADLCFLYLHVSQNTAIYRNTEKRPEQTSSRTEGFVFRVHIKVKCVYSVLQVSDLA